ncbi:aa3-type cytochrome c oxidase subunit IV [Methylocystis sp. S23]
MAPDIRAGSLPGGRRQRRQRAPRLLHKFERARFAATTFFLADAKAAAAGRVRASQNSVGPFGFASIVRERRKRAARQRCGMSGRRLASSSCAAGLPRVKPRSGSIPMASNRGSASTDADWAEHEKTYKGFLWLLKFSAAGSAITLLALYFLFAR